MVTIPRDRFLAQLIKKKDNGLVKVITGVRRCGKSFLLFHLFAAYLNSVGIGNERIIRLPLDTVSNARFRNPLQLDEYIRGVAAGASDRLYVFIDEIQLVREVPNPWLDDPSETIGFVDVLLGLMNLDNVDLYVTGSNSKMLSNDIVTQFRDRGDPVRLYPLTFSEFNSVFEGPPEEAWRQYCTYGGLPRAALLDTHGERSAYLQDLLDNTYRRDIVERHDIRNNEDVLSDLLDIVASSVGSLTNPSKLAHAFGSVKERRISPETISTYLEYYSDAFVIDSAHRYDVRGRHYMDTPLKYYFTDVGLRNARIGFRQQDENHLMENVVFNELKVRGYGVDVGMVEYRRRDEEGRQTRTQLEVDFVAIAAGRTHYVQVAQGIDDPGKREQEIASLVRIPDSFGKTVVVRDHIMPWFDEHGIRYMGIRDFLLDENSLDR